MRVGDQPISCLHQIVRVLIIGCGYVGVTLGAELVRQGHEVFGMRRGDPGIEELEANGIIPLLADVTDQASLKKHPSSFDWVVNAISSSKGGPEEYRAVYLEGTKHILDWLEGIQKYILISSTSVYAQTDGSVVTEQSPAEGASPTSRVLVETESLLLGKARDEHFPAIILRPSGIYGPGRGVLFHQFVRGEAALTGSGERLLNMIHRDDLAGAIIAALEQGRAGEIYNATDNEPVSQLEFFRWLSQQLGKRMPESRSDAEGRIRKRGSTNKRVSNQKLRSELGYTLKFATFREGYAPEIPT